MGLTCTPPDARQPSGRSVAESNLWSQISTRVWSIHRKNLYLQIVSLCELSSVIFCWVFFATIRQNYDISPTCALRHNIICDCFGVFLYFFNKESWQWLILIQLKSSRRRNLFFFGSSWKHLPVLTANILRSRGPEQMLGGLGRKSRVIQARIFIGQAQKRQRHESCHLLIHCMNFSTAVETPVPDLLASKSTQTAGD